MRLISERDDSGRRRILEEKKMRSNRVVIYFVGEANEADAKCERRLKLEVGVSVFVIDEYFVSSRRISSVTTIIVVVDAYHQHRRAMNNLSDGGILKQYFC